MLLDFFLYQICELTWRIFYFSCAEYIFFQLYWYIVLSSIFQTVRKHFVDPKHSLEGIILKVRQRQ